MSLCSYSIKYIEPKCISERPTLKQAQEGT